MSQNRSSTKRFAIATRCRADGRDIWQSVPSSYDEAMLVLIHNGWIEQQAKADLDGCPDRWIPVNENTQIA
jgi:hypothetical protein